MAVDIPPYPSLPAHGAVTAKNPDSTRSIGPSGKAVALVELATWTSSPPMRDKLGAVTGISAHGLDKLGQTALIKPHVSTALNLIRSRHEGERGTNEQAIASLRLGCHIHRFQCATQWHCIRLPVEWVQVQRE